MPSTHDVAICDFCSGRIRWTVTAAGNRQAVNADPNPEGNLAVYTDATGRLRSRGLTKERPTLEHSEWQAMPHAAECKRPVPPRAARPGRRPVVPYWRRT